MMKSRSLLVSRICYLSNGQCLLTNAFPLSVTTDKFSEKVGINPRLLQPAIELQRIIRRKTLGLAYWQSQQQRREREFSEFDDKAGETWEGLLAILDAAVKKEKEERELGGDDEEGKEEDGEEDDGDESGDDKDDEGEEEEEEEEGAAEKSPTKGKNPDH